MHGPFFTKAAPVRREIPDQLLLRIRAGIPVDAEDLDGIDLNQKISVQEQTLLHLAVRTSPHNVRLLIAGGANVNALAENNRTPLHVAALHNQLEIVGLLVGSEADMTITTHFPQETAKEIAQRKGHSAIVQYLEAEESRLRSRMELS